MVSRWAAGLRLRVVLAEEGQCFMLVAAGMVGSCIHFGS